MDVQNFRFVQNFKYKQQELDSVLKKQKSMLLLLRKEYENLKDKDKMEPSKAEKLEQKKSLRNVYTFKLPSNKQKHVDEAPEISRYGWYQRPMSALPHKIQELYKQRNRMIQLGNSYSKNNKNCPLATEAIKRASSAKTPSEMKLEMLNRAKELGNNYSFRFRHKHPQKLHKTCFDDYKKHEQLINQKNGMEKIFKSNEKLPQNFSQKYSKVLNEIQCLEESLDHNCCSSGAICHEIFRLDNSISGKLIDELKRPSFINSDVNDDKIQMDQALDTIEIAKIIEATNIVDQNVKYAFGSEELTLPNDECNEICGNSISSEYFECQSIGKSNLSREEQEFYNIQQFADDNLFIKLNPDVHEICESYIDGMSFSYDPKLHPSFEDLSKIKVSADETKSNTQENDDYQEISQASHEICKSQLISNSNSVESSETTRKVLFHRDLHAYSAEDQHTNNINNKINEYPIKRVSWSDQNLASTEIKKHDINRDCNNEAKFNKLLLHV